MQNVQIINHSNAQNALSKLEGEYITITSYGQQLASWGKSMTSGLLLSTFTKRKTHKLNLLQADELNEFTSNHFQHKYFIVDTGSSKLFVHHDDNTYTQDEINKLIK